MVEGLKERGWRVAVSEPFSHNRACMIRILDECSEAAAMSATEGEPLAW